MFSSGDVQFDSFCKFIQKKTFPFLLHLTRINPRHAIETTEKENNISPIAIVSFMLLTKLEKKPTRYLIASILNKITRNHFRKEKHLLFYSLRKIQMEYYLL